MQGIAQYTLLRKVWALRGSSVLLPTRRTAIFCAYYPARKTFGGLLHSKHISCRTLPKLCKSNIILINKLSKTASFQLFLIAEYNQNKNIEKTFRRKNEHEHYKNYWNIDTSRNWSIFYERWLGRKFR